jgi:hypothetical protein
MAQKLREVIDEIEIGPDGRPVVVLLAGLIIYRFTAEWQKFSKMDTTATISPKIERKPPIGRQTSSGSGSAFGNVAMNEKLDFSSDGFFRRLVRKNLWIT